MEWTVGSINLDVSRFRMGRWTRGTDTRNNGFLHGESRICDAGDLNAGGRWERSLKTAAWDANEEGSRNGFNRMGRSLE